MPDATLPLLEADEDGDGQVSGSSFGRYVVLRRLGSGGSADVFAAVDPILERSVALKILRARAEDTALLVREGRMLARLSHRNVVTVHDVGIEDEQAFLAMELVNGDHLGDWLRGRELKPAAIVDLLLGAGQGIAAAHEAEIFHGDIKPANILVGEDGVPKVGDFGIAKWGPGDARRNKAVGTPRYMAPEQWDGAAPDAASDQFSFCVVVWEALSGTTPQLLDSTSESLGDDTQESTRRTPAMGGKPEGLNRRQLAALERGLRENPAERWPSMAALLAELRPRPSRHWQLLATAGVLSAAGVAALAWTEDDACTGAEARVAEVWGAAARTELDAAFSATELPYAAASAERVVAGLDDYAARWAATHRDVCEATAVREEQSPELLDARMRCLTQARAGLRAAVDVLGSADASVVERGDAVVDGLPDVERCAELDADHPAIRVPDNPGDAEVVVRVRETLAEISARSAANQHTEGFELLEGIATDVEALEFAPVTAEYLVYRADALRGLGRAAEAEEAALAGMEPAAVAGLWEHAAGAATILAYVTSQAQGRPDEGLAYARTAVRLSAAEGVGQKVRWVAKLHLAHAHAVKGDIAKAEPLYREVAQARLEAGEVAEHATTLADLAAVISTERRDDEAIELLETSVAALLEAKGEHHPSLAVTRFNLASILIRHDRADEAEPHLQAALATWEKTYSGRHPDVARAQQAFGNLWTVRADWDEAIAEFRKAHALRVELFGPDAPILVESHMGLARAYRALGREKEAAQAYLDGIAVAGTPLHLAVARSNYAKALIEWGRKDEAERELVHALSALAEKAPDHHMVDTIKGALEKLRE